MIWLCMADAIMQSSVVFLRMYLTIIQRVRSYQSSRILMCKWSQGILRSIIELASQLPKHRRPLLDLLTEKTLKRFQPIKKTIEVEHEKHSFHAGTNIFVNENLTPMNETITYNCRKLKRRGLIHACYSRNSIVYIKQNETSRPIKVFHLGKLISLFPDHFQNNDENDRYHAVSIDANSSLQSSY